MRPDQLERRIRARLDALGPAPRAQLLHVLMLPDFERAQARRGMSSSIVGVTTRHGRRTEPRRVENLLPRTQVAGPGRLPYLMERESARAIEEGQPSQTGQRRKPSS